MYSLKQGLKYNVYTVKRKYLDNNLKNCAKL